MAISISSPQAGQMHAITFHGPRQIKLSLRPLPKLELDGDVIVKMEVSSLCGTDLHPYRGDKPGLDEGTIMGHELVGVVQEVGAGVKSLRPGQRVVSAFTTCCGSCWYCTHQLTCRCEHDLGARCYGWVSQGKGLEGVQAEYVRVPLADTTLLPVPDNVSAEQALLCGDMLATGWYCAERADIRELLKQQGEAILAVVGCGPVGLAAIAAAISQGATKVYAIDTVPERLALAKSFGAKLIPEGEDAVAYVKSKTGGRGPDSVMEAVGAPGALRCAFDAVRLGGVVSSVGMQHGEFSWSPAEGYNKNITYRNGRCPARVFMDELLKRMASGDKSLIATTQVISHRVALQDEQGVKDVYNKFDKRLDNCIKVVVYNDSKE